MNTIQRHWPLLLIGALALFVRLAWLDMDPPIFLSYGQVGDEGLWVHNARLNVLFGERTIDDFSHDYAVAPLFSWVVEVSFRLFGVGFASARLPSALFGFLTVVAAYDIARRLLPKKLATSVLLLLSIHPLWLLHNRLAVGESIMLFCLTSAWWLWLSGKHTWHIFVGGMMLGLSLLAKSTSVQYVAVFIVLNLISWRILLERRRAAFFSLGFLSTALFAAWHFWSERESVVLIFSTFARVYSWANAGGVTQIVTSIILHPFWGSPFMIGFVWLALMNCIGIGRSFLLSYQTFWREQPVIAQSFVWLIIGILPAFFGANHPSTRFYPLILPIILLAFSNPIKTRRTCIGRTEVFLSAASLIAVSIIFSKLFLAIARRTILSTDAREVLFWPVVLTLFFICLGLYRCSMRIRTAFTAHQSALWKLILGFVLLSIFVQFFIDWALLSGYIPQSPLMKYAFAGILGLLIYLFRKRISSEIVLSGQLVVCVIALLVVFSNPSYSIRDSSRQLGTFIARGEYTTGFLIHELALENMSYPIYWGPRQPFVGTFNESYAKTLPTILVVPEYLEGERVPSVNAWPGLTDYTTIGSEQVGMLTWHRRWGPLIRDVQLGVYQLER